MSVGWHQNGKLKSRQHLTSRYGKHDQKILHSVTACFVYNELKRTSSGCKGLSWQLWNWTLRLVTFPPQKSWGRKNKFPNIHAFFQSWKQKRQVFSPQTPASKTHRISGFALPLPLESPEFAGPTGRQFGWLVFWSTFLNKGIGDLKGQRTNLEKTFSTSRFKVATTPIWLHLHVRTWKNKVYSPRIQDVLIGVMMQSAPIIFLCNTAHVGKKTVSWCIMYRNNKHQVASVASSLGTATAKCGKKENRDAKWHRSTEIVSSIWYVAKHCKVDTVGKINSNPKKTVGMGSKFGEFALKKHLRFGS